MKINKSLILLLMFFLVASFRAQEKSLTAKVDKDKVIEVGYVDSYDKLPKLKFEKIAESEFNAYKSVEFFTVPKIKQNGKYFYLLTKKNKYEFKNFLAGDSSLVNKDGNIFIGFYPKLNLFAINEASVSEGLTFGNLVLIDKETDFRYKIISIGDGKVENPIPSKNGKYLVYFHNYDYQHEDSFIAVLKIGEKSEPKNYLREYLSLKSDTFAVEKIVWVNDNSFVVKGFEEVLENDKWVKKYSFYKTSFE